MQAIKTFIFIKEFYLRQLQECLKFDFRYKALCKKLNKDIDVI